MSVPPSSHTAKTHLSPAARATRLQRIFARMQEGERSGRSPPLAEFAKGPDRRRAVGLEPGRGRRKIRP